MKAKKLLNLLPEQTRISIKETGENEWLGFYKILEKKEKKWAKSLIQP